MNFSLETVLKGFMQSFRRKAAEDFFQRVVSDGGWEENNHVDVNFFGFFIRNLKHVTAEALIGGCKR